MSRYKRRRVLVSPIQYRLLGFNLAYCGALAFCLAVGLWWPLIEDFDNPLLEAERARVAETLLYLHARLLPIAAVLLGLFCWHSVLVSHRNPRALVRFRRGVPGRRERRPHEAPEAPRTGLPPREAAEFNRMLESHAARLRELEQGYRSLAEDWSRGEGETASRAEREVFAHRLSELNRAWSTLELGDRAEAPTDGELEAQASLARASDSSRPVRPELREN